MQELTPEYRAIKAALRRLSRSDRRTPEQIAQYLFKRGHLGNTQGPHPNPVTRYVKSVTGLRNVIVRLDWAVDKSKTGPMTLVPYPVYLFLIDYYYYYPSKYPFIYGK